MEKKQAVERIIEIFNTSRVGVMSTAQNNIPNSRYMIFYNDDEVLYTKTSNETAKYDELERNPYTHILLGYNETNNNSYAEVYGKVEVVNDQEVINELWKSQDKTFFNSKEDDDFVVLKVVPERVKIMNDDESPVEVDFKS